MYKSRARDLYKWSDPPTYEKPLGDPTGNFNYSEGPTAWSMPVSASRGYGCKQWTSGVVPHSPAFVSFRANY